MGISELRQHTEVYGKSSVIAARKEWMAGIASTAEVSILGGLRRGFAHRFDARFAILNELPVEFFNHELMQVDTDKFEDVSNFVKEWGFPFSPLHNVMAYTDFIPGYLAPIDKSGEHLNAIGATQNLWWNMDDDVFEGVPDGTKLLKDAISYEEAASTIRVLQECFSTIIDAVVTGWDDASFGKLYAAEQFVNLGASNPLALDIAPHVGILDLRQGQGLPGLGYLTAAICNQFIETVADSTPWRLCANRDGRNPCMRVFKYSRTGSKSHDKDARFCCTRCANADKQRRKRAKGKANSA